MPTLLHLLGYIQGVLLYSSDEFREELVYDVEYSH
jgi:hypothetical protein